MRITNTCGTLTLAWTSSETDDARSVAWGDWDGDGDLGTTAMVYPLAAALDPAPGNNTDTDVDTIDAILIFADGFESGDTGAWSAGNEPGRFIRLRREVVEAPMSITSS